MAAETQYTANTGIVTISTANSNLDGTGTLGTVLTAASNGTLVKRIWIKAQTSTTSGMIRFFVTGSGATYLIAEVEVPAVTKSSTDPSFEMVLPINYALDSGYVLKAATANAETFNIIAEGLDWAYYATSVRSESTQYTANTGMASISTANTALNGSGTITSVLTADASSKGTLVNSVKVKATVNTQAGMVRLFVTPTGAEPTHYLLTEIPVPAVTKSATDISFGADVSLDFALKAGYSLRASTEKAETFNVIAEGADWAYPA